VSAAGITETGNGNGVFLWSSISSLPVARAHGVRVASVIHTDDRRGADLVDGVACGFAVLAAACGEFMPQNPNEQSAL
jgi:hypothetical protein